MQRLEGALHAFTDGGLDDDVAILAIAPRLDRVAAPMRPLDRSAEPAAGTARIRSRPMDDRSASCVERLFDAFNRRDEDGIVDVCDEEMEFFAVTAEEVGRSAPYVGTDGPAATTSTTSPRSGKSC